MHLAQILAGLNWLAVFVATVIAFILGTAWYSKALFGSAWMQEVGLTEEDVNKAKMARTLGGAFLLQIVAAIALDGLVVIRRSSPRGKHDADAGVARDVGIDIGGD